MKINRIKKPAKKVTPESSLTRAVRDYLKLRGVYHWKSWQGPMSSPKGVSDIIGLYKGRFLAIELKAPGKKPTPDQAKFLATISEYGGFSIWSDNLDEIIAYIDGIIARSNNKEI